MEGKIKIIGIVFILVSIILLAGCTKNPIENPQDNKENNEKNDNENIINPVINHDSDIQIIKTGSTYSSVQNKSVSGWFSNGQDADIVLNWFGFNNSGGPLRFYHPMGIASDGKHLLLADTCNNRILIWNTLPVGNTPPDIVLGQKDFNSNTPGTSQYKLRWPVAVATDGEKVVVADTYNNRILIWNSFPTENGQPADLVLGQKDFEHAISTYDKYSINWPWAVWTNGEKLIVANTRSGNIMIWNSFPTINDQPPDVILTNDDFGTPRNIESDGETYLIIGDHNAKGTGRGGNFIWNTFPESNIDYDTYIGGEVLWCSEVIDNDLYGVIPGRVVVIPDFKQLIGNIDLQELIDNHFAQVFYNISYEAGDGSGMVYTKDGSNEISYFSLYNGGRIVGYFGKPEDREPDFTIGSDSNINPLTENYYFMDNPVPLVYNDTLVVLCGFTKRIEVWKDLPDENCALPDIVYQLNFEPLSAAVYNNKFYVIGRGGDPQGGFAVWKWNDLIDGEKPEVFIGGKLGNIDIHEGNGITFDDKYAYITANGKLYIWKQPFNWNDPPFKEIELEQDVTKIMSNGEKLAAVYTGYINTVILIDVDSLISDKPEFFELLPYNNPNSIHFNLPENIFIDNNHLFVADTCFNRVLIWNEIPTSGEDQPDVVIGQNSFENDLPPKFTRDGLFWPAGVWFDGSYLWVGEYKFSHRVLRYSIK